MKKVILLTTEEVEFLCSFMERAPSCNMDHIGSDQSRIRTALLMQLEPQAQIDNSVEVLENRVWPR